eukprot:scaffold1951_cov258-Pinguiococcus_pyrenoidosus.AAC.2
MSRLAEKPCGRDRPGRSPQSHRRHEAGRRPQTQSGIRDRKLGAALCVAPGEEKPVGPGHQRVGDRNLRPSTQDATSRRVDEGDVHAFAVALFTEGKVDPREACLLDFLLFFVVRGSGLDEDAHLLLLVGLRARARRARIAAGEVPVAGIPVLRGRSCASRRRCRREGRPAAPAGPAVPSGTDACSGRRKTDVVDLRSWTMRT